MSMEKNGAISNQTPQTGCCGGKSSCNTHPDAQARQKMASEANGNKQKVLFPADSTEADELEKDLTKEAIDAVKRNTEA